MAILKSEVRNRFSTIPNSVIQAKDISDGDYRLLIYLYSLPDGWKINQGYLGSQLGCNRRNVNAKLGRIKEAGYLDIIREKNDKNVDYIYLLKEKKDESASDVSENNVESVNDVSENDSHINTYKINILSTCKEIIEHLNEKSKSNFKPNTKSTQTKINARLNEGYKLDDFIAVIDKKCDEWIGTEYEKYLCPETLFGTKFEKYLNQKVVNPATQEKHQEEIVSQEVYEGLIYGITKDGKRIVIGVVDS